MNTARVVRNRAIGMYDRFLALLIVGCMVNSVVASGPPGQGKASTIPETAVAYDLKEILAFEVPDTVRNRFITGVYTECRSEPDPSVKRYPAFRSGKPLYGSFHIGGVSAEYKSGYDYAFALDESAGTGCGYDRIYLDTNLNGDLTDDPCRAPMKDVPAQALFAIKTLRTQVCFETVAIRVTPEDSPEHRLEVMPRFMAYTDGPAYAMLVTTKAHTGAIRIGGIEFQAVLGHAPSIQGWFDHPNTGLLLIPTKPSAGRPALPGYEGGLLKHMHRQGDTWYRCAATPNGDRLFVWPYQGPFGTLEIKSGGRPARRISAGGSLGSKDATLSLTQRLGERNLPPSDSYRLPVGDYQPQSMSFSFDSLNCLVLRNMHVDGRPRGRPLDDPSVYAIRIRENQPSVLDFSGKPQVLFALPAKDHRVKPGGSLEVKAVLIDPAFDIMFRSIRKGRQLDPKVVIKRANGEIVAEGTMPFG
jgi:hypothetical protein